MRLAPLGVALCSLAACVHTAPQTAAHQGGQPLQVQIVTAPNLAYSRVQKLAFVLSRPAYVAAFQVVAGRGVRLLYPSSSHEQRLDAGVNRVTETPFYYGEYLLPRRTPPLAQREQRFTYIVASEHPLGMDSLTEPGALRRHFGIEQFAVSTPSSLMDQILAIIIPPGASDASWATDFVFR